MYTFEELFTEEIKDTDAKTNGRTAADKMRSVKEDVLGVSRAFPFRHRENAFFFLYCFFFLPCGHLDFESAVTAQSDEFKGSFHSSCSRLLNVKTPRNSILSLDTFRYVG